ncbi:serine/threonine-protein kinase [Streptomyces ipomoeae]|uniref:serine/threonine-protein kinase n=1 Tax=Streptomyces ipomoeae TaxID=103232 RepID=UPI0015F02AFE|nr:serine/threonine-protein kinase [Streptomyces ipomoeae]MDX2700354.1 serine/threonine-protein kinase [Streptomyces ipomoeae]MDX2846010.1 serine/threonine-protein kinase [Streptomyces ipomoeae]
MATGETPEAPDRESEVAAGERRLIGGRYELAERIGEGGMGAVWAGRDLLVDREVAVKEAYVTERQPRVERVLREARAAARVNHPAVVTIHDVVMADGHPWIVMERVHGESLAALLERERVLPEREAARIALAVVEALAAAHARGVLHRDVKPGNVLLGPDGRVVLTDFGIAYIEGEESLTRAGEFVGSLAYTAPERMGGHRPGPPADLWSLGVLLFQMVEGWSPFQREAVEGTVAAVLTTKAPTSMRAPGLAPLIGELLAPEPEDRPTAERVAAVLRATATGAAHGAVTGAGNEAATGAATGTAASRSEVVETVGAAEPTEPTEPGGRPGKPRTGRRRVWAAVVVAAGLLALVPLGIDRWGGGNGASGEGGSVGRSATPTPSPSPSPSRTSAKPYVRATTDEFSLDVPTGWQSHGKNGDGQYRYSKDGFELIVVPGRDRTSTYSGNPLVYMREHEPELQPFRDSTWATSTGLRLIETGGHTSAEGSFTWETADGQEVYVENMALLVEDRYHVVLVRGPEAEREAVARVYEHAVSTYEYEPVT